MAETVTTTKGFCLQLSQVKCLQGEPNVPLGEPDCPWATAVQRTNAPKPTGCLVLELELGSKGSWSSTPVAPQLCALTLQQRWPKGKPTGQRNPPGQITVQHLVMLNYLACYFILVNYCEQQKKKAYKIHYLLITAIKLDLDVLSHKYM